MQMSSDSLTKHELASWAALHLSVFRLTSREDFWAAKGMKRQAARGFSPLGGLVHASRCQWFSLELSVVGAF